MRRRVAISYMVGVLHALLGSLILLVQWRELYALGDPELLKPVMHWSVLSAVDLPVALPLAMLFSKPDMDHLGYLFALDVTLIFVSSLMWCGIAWMFGSAIAQFLRFVDKRTALTTMGISVRLSSTDN